MPTSRSNRSISILDSQNKEVLRPKEGEKAIMKHIKIILLICLLVRTATSNNYDEGVNNNNDGVFDFPGPFYDPFIDNKHQQPSHPPSTDSPVSLPTRSPTPEASQPSPMPVSPMPIVQEPDDPSPPPNATLPNATLPNVTLARCAQGASCPAGTECIEELDDTCINLSCVESFDGFGSIFHDPTLVLDISTRFLSIGGEAVAQLVTALISDPTLEQISGAIGSVIDPSDFDFFNDPIFDEISTAAQQGGNEFVSCLVDSRRRLQTDIPFISFVGIQGEIDLPLFQGSLALFRAFDNDSGEASQAKFYRVCRGASIGGAGSGNFISGAILDEELENVASETRIIDVDFASGADIGIAVAVSPNFLVEAEAGVGLGASLFGGSLCRIRQI